MTEKRKTSGWGWGIYGLYGGFVVFVLALVFFASFQDFSLVEDNYYEKGLEYQSRIESERRVSELSEPLKIEVDNASGELVVSFPEYDDTQTPQGSIWLYRPSNADYDQTFAIAPDREGKQALSGANVIPGMWRVKVDWQVGDSTYYSEQELFVGN